jgi:hypothetical protein
VKKKKALGEDGLNLNLLKDTGKEFNNRFLQSSTFFGTTVHSQNIDKSYIIPLLLYKICFFLFCTPQ